MRLLGMIVMFGVVAASRLASADELPLVPKIDGAWWTVAGDPDIGELTDPRQQPVDFAIWQATDGTWQLWSCIRHTKCGGRTRLFHRWEGPVLTAKHWKPIGIAMQADPKLGETPGGLQAPHATLHKGRYYMLYGDWQNICLAMSDDGKTFQRRLNTDRLAGMFSEGNGFNTRDPMAIRLGNRWYCYYTAYPNDQGAVYCRTSRDLVTWSHSRRVAFGGAAGTNKYSAECPFVLKHDSGYYYLFRTQRYGEKAQTSVYRSRDPLNFGIEDDKFLVCTLPVAAPEIINNDGQYYIACLLPSLKGIQIAKLKWTSKP